MPKPAKDGLGQGAYTDFSASPLARRRQLDPMPPAEAEAFDWVIRKLGEEEPEADLRELVEGGFDQGWFELGESGELRVSKEAPE